MSILLLCWTVGWTMGYWSRDDGLGGCWTAQSLSRCHTTRPVASHSQASPQQRSVFP